MKNVPRSSVRAGYPVERYRIKVLYKKKRRKGFNIERKDERGCERERENHALYVYR